jgi:hypothetical protein
MHFMPLSHDCRAKKPIRRRRGNVGQARARKSKFLFVDSCDDDEGAGRLGRAVAGGD